MRTLLLIPSPKKTLPLSAQLAVLNKLENHDPLYLLEDRAAVLSYRCACWRSLGLLRLYRSMPSVDSKPLKLSLVGFSNGREGYHRRPQLPSCLRFDVPILAQFLPRIFQRSLNHAARFSTDVFWNFVEGHDLASLLGVARIIASLDSMIV
jgi:hypothetical protein